MARTPRSEVFEEDAVGCYHCINRCVRRAFLCGLDPLSGKNFDHRKEWIRSRLEELAALFAIDVLDYAVLSNHLHVILRNRPDIVAQWSDQEVARRWWNLFPQRKDKQGRPAEPKPHELKSLIANQQKRKELRRRLSHISWFMRCLAENIARRSNREDQTTGRFWQGRFKCQRLLDESALLTCSMYVDLNPIRAGVARTPETSRYTSAYDRIRSQSKRSPKKRSSKRTRSKRTSSTTVADRWLSPLPLQEVPQKETSPRHRASNQGFLPMTLKDYLRLLDWTGREVRRDKRGSIPAELAPLLEGFQVSADSWIDAVVNFSRWFGSAAGRVEALASEAARRGRSSLKGISRSRTLFT